MSTWECLGTEGEIRGGLANRDCDGETPTVGMSQLSDPVQDRVEKSSMLQCSQGYIRQNLDLSSIKVHLTCLPSLAKDSFFVGVMVEAANNILRSVGSDDLGPSVCILSSFMFAGGAASRIQWKLVKTVSRRFTVP